MRSRQQDIFLDRFEQTIFVPGAEPGRYAAGFPNIYRFHGIASGEGEIKMMILPMIARIWKRRRLGVFFVISSLRQLAVAADYLYNSEVC